MAETSRQSDDEPRVDDVGADGVLPPLASNAFIITSLPDDFDIDAVFKSERELAEAATAPGEDPGELVDAVQPEIIPLDEPLPIRSSPPNGSRVSVSIADLVENHVQLEWHEAVAIAMRLCAALERQAEPRVDRPLIEPWSIEITDHGELKMLPGATGSDPVVKQVGRVLGALLQESIAPAELRLLASQASFEVPVYVSIDELSTALKRFDRGVDAEDPIRAAFRRAMEARNAKPLPPHRPDPKTELSQSRYWLPPLLPPAPRIAAPAKPSLPARVAVAIGGAAIVAVAAGVWAHFESTQPAAGVTPPTISEPVKVNARVTPPPAPTATVKSPPLPTAEAVSPAPPQKFREAPAPRNHPAPPIQSQPIGVLRTDPAPRPKPTGAGVIVETRPAARGNQDPLDAAERRASALLASGKSADATLAFDSIVMRDPGHRLNPERLTPEATDALRRSKQTVLPTLARSHFEAGRAALDLGDFSLAIAEAERALRLLEDPDLDGVADELKPAARDLLATASGAKRADEETVYTLDDHDVTPPRPVGRQLPATAPPSTPATAIGRLEILVSRTGAVERVTLHTPSNAYQERMIVSAAKAWRYKPAQRNGRPVRYSLILSINLPHTE